MWYEHMAIANLDQKTPIYPDQGMQKEKHRNTC